MKNLGWDRPELLARAFELDEPLEIFASTAEELWPGSSCGWSRLHDLWEAATKIRSMTPGRLAAVADPDVEVWAHKKRRKTLESVEAARIDGQRFVPPPGKPPTGRWPTRRQRKLAVESSTAAKATVEDEEKARWVAEIVRLARLADLPIVKRLENTEHSHLLGKTLCRGLRTGTLRKRARDAKRMVAFFHSAHGAPWPSDVGELMDYLVARASEPCGKSVLPGIQSTVYFFEKGGGVSQQHMLAKDPLIENLIEGLQGDILKGSHATVAAPREPLMFTVIRERIVVDEGKPLYHRAYAWWKGVQSWASMRFSDHVGLDPASLRMSDGSLRGEINRTKTTGADKTIGSRAFIVAAECYLECPNWIAIGFEIWSGFHFERKYFLPLPTADLQGVVPLEVNYMDACAMTRVLLADYVMPSDDEGGMDLLLLPGLAGFWTEHSPRHNVPSWAASILDLTEDNINLLGGWVQRGTAPRYIETAERKIRNIQASTAKLLRGARGGFDIVDEGKLFHRLRKFMALRGFTEDEQDMQIATLRWSSPLAGEDDSLSMPEKAAVVYDIEEEVPRPNWEPDPSPRYDGTLPRELLGQYSISIGVKSKHRCLHILGGCHRVPELHYSQYEICAERPDDTAYDDFCKQCWPEKCAGADSDSEDGSQSSSSSESGAA